MVEEAFVSHRCPHCGQSNGWRGPSREGVRFENGAARAKGFCRCRECKGALLAKENPIASACMGVALLSLVALFVNRWWLVSPWIDVVAMAVFSLALIVWLGFRLSGRGFVLQRAPESAAAALGTQAEAAFPAAPETAAKVADALQKDPDARP